MKARFFGLHIDLHPNEQDTELGRKVSAGMVRRIIRAARPDYIQYDCKGHPGYLGYPNSAVSSSAPGIVRDSLAIYRRVTAAEGVRLLVHFSGVWDGIACQQHPEWQAVSADPKQPFTGKASVFGPYVKARLIPQMREIIERYRVDGFWVDGECWALEPDQCAEAMRRFRRRTGARRAPTGPGEPHWVEWCAIHREQFFAYLKTYMDAIHAAHPGIEIASNWLYSHMAPEPTSRLPVDFASGDFSAQNAVADGRFAARCLADTGLPWDLMAWAFAWHWQGGQRGYKPAQQLQQEAAIVLGQGGGFQVYFHPDRHGGFAAAHVELLRRVARFCHERRAVSFHTAPVPQVALVLDTESLWRQTPTLYAHHGAAYQPMRGMLGALLAAGHSVDIVAGHRCAAKLSPYPVAVYPEWEQPDAALVGRLLRYVRAGGRLLVTGAPAAQAFWPMGTARDVATYVWPRRPFEPGAAQVKGRWCDLRPAGAEVLAWRTPGFTEDEGRVPAAVLHRVGRGRLILAPGPLGAAFHQNSSPWLRDLCDELTRRLYRPAVRVTGSKTVDVALRRHDDRWLVHLTNTAGAPTHDDKSPGRVFADAIPPVGPLTLTVAARRGWSLRHAEFAPDGTLLKVRRAGGGWRIEVPALHIHAVVVLPWRRSQRTRGNT